MLELASGLATASAHARLHWRRTRVAAGGRRRFDKGGEQFYDQISALHKAARIRPGWALYWYGA
jgi:putative ATPase